MDHNHSDEARIARIVCPACAAAVAAGAVTRVRDAFLGVCEFLGPVAGSIRDDLSKEEKRRALATAVTGWLAATTEEAKRAALAQNTEFWGVVVIPTAFGVLVYFLECARRRRHGDTLPTEIPKEGKNNETPAPS